MGIKTDTHRAEASWPREASRCRKAEVGLPADLSVRSQIKFGHFPGVGGQRSSEASGHGDSAEDAMWTHKHEGPDTPNPVA